MDGRNERRFLSSTWNELWKHWGDGESCLHSSFPIILINFNTKDAFFFLPPHPESERKMVEKEQPLREEERRSEQAEEKWKGCLAVDRL